MQLAIVGLSELPNQTTLVIEIPSFEAGLIAFLFFFLLMGLTYYVLRTERNKPAPPSSPIRSDEILRYGNPMSTSDAPFLAVLTLVILELVLDVMIIVSVLQGMGSIAVGMMFALAAFLAAAIMVVYRSTFMEDLFTRKTRLEIVAANLADKTRQGEEDD